jgi:hypothetical protein
MRQRFPEIVEKGRVLQGPYGSPPHKTFGAFFLTRSNGRRFKVIAADGRETGWDHVSVSMPKRCPTWDEMCWVKNLFFGPEETVIQFHPPASEYVNDCGNCLHLWRRVAGIELPPSILVGLGRKDNDRP